MQRLPRLLNLSENTGHRILKYRYLLLVALSSAIDSRIFLFCGKALAAGGPASLLLTEALSCIMLYCALDPLMEMMVYQPSGSFICFAYHYIDPAWAFTVGWIYVFHCFTIIPFDIIAAAKMMKAFLPSINIAVWLSTFIVALSATSLSGTTYFMQISALLTLAKLIMITGLGLLTVSLASKKGLPPEYKPFEYWKRPGAFNGGLFGAAGTLFFSGTSPSGLDILSLGAQESNSTPDTVRLGSRALFWTLTTLRIFNAVAAGIEAPFTDLRLLDSHSDYGRVSTTFDNTFGCLWGIQGFVGTG
ncbi:uncharacterized protein Z519_12726 [Cladophialophora bantiana CBS 173.52]|uniref:Amino acid permease/ SLC12A domain-containing protein n=1 Tax=Cladophialophora bantiana (strain ATCC 10958 / CBS 173.52 / CDC B-1940 / NIH 8579) TaxID=1442370 RepID=A0A0D2E970_CLAB1|nr:uncharacterized protein Z519_12726 [Cladophialophora bantiana CBS 173.52]KIW86671.1 hypothetical protein Z519_12726 [Cladophialophora bantiana CBS 173.52]